MDKEQLIFTARVDNKYCSKYEKGVLTTSRKDKNGWLFEGNSKDDTCIEHVLTLDIENVFKGKNHKSINVISDYQMARESCDSRVFHPTKSVLINLKTTKVPNYIFGQKYLFIINRNKKKYYVRAGEKLGESLHYINKYMQYNTAHKPIKQN